MIRQRRPRAEKTAPPFRTQPAPLMTRVGNSVDEETANAIIAHLTDIKLITPNEAALMRSAISRNALALPISAKDVLRAAVLKNMLIQAFRNAEGGDQQ